MLLKQGQLIEFRYLSDYDPRIDNLIESGYQSSERYTVNRIETHHNTTISLDLRPLEELYVKRWEVTDDERNFYKEIINEGHSLAAFDRAEFVAVALAGVRKWNGTLWIWEFHVAQRYQRHGIGRQMMEILAAKASLLNLRTMLVETQSTNLPAIRFYRAVGFEIEGFDLSYYSNDDIPDGEVAIFMKRKIH